MSKWHPSKVIDLKVMMTSFCSRKGRFCDITKTSSWRRYDVTKTSSWRLHEFASQRRQNDVFLTLVVILSLREHISHDDVKITSFRSHRSKTHDDIILVPSKDGFVTSQRRHYDVFMSSHRKDVKITTSWLLSWFFCISCMLIFMNTLKVVYFFDYENT